MLREREWPDAVVVPAARCNSSRDLPRMTGVGLANFEGLAVGGGGIESLVLVLSDKEVREATLAIGFATWTGSCDPPLAFPRP